MTSSLFSEGKEYISASRAAEKIGYASDYIGQLCRGKKIPGQLVGRTWYVDFNALEKHKQNRHIGKPRKSNYSKSLTNLSVPLEKLKQSNLSLNPSPELPRFINKGLLIYENDDRPRLPELLKQVKSTPPVLTVSLLKQSCAFSLFFIMVLGAGFWGLEKASPSTAFQFERSLSALSETALGTLTDFSQDISKSQVAAVSFVDGLTNSLDFLITGFKDLKDLALSKIRPMGGLTNADARFVTETPATTIQTDNQNQKAITEAQPTYSLEGLKGELKTELETYIRAQLSQASPVTIYQSSPIYNNTFRNEILLADTRPTVTRQSSSDVGHLSSAMRSLANEGVFTNPNISGGSLSGTAADLTFLSLSGSTTLQNFTFQSATGTSATTTNFFTTNASTTNFWANIGSIGTLTTGNILTTSSSTLQNFSAQTGTLNNLLVLGSSTLQNFTATNSTTTNATSSTFAITGNGAGLLFTGSGNHDITSTSGTLRIGANTVIGNILALDDTIDIGTSGTRFDKVYANEVNATTLVGTLTGGNLTAETFAINSDNATADTEDAFLAFERGSVSPNALLEWDAASDNFIFNSDVTVGPGIGSGNFLVHGSTTLQNFTFQNATGTRATTTNLAISSLTSTRIPFVSTGGTLIDSSNLTFDLANNRLTTTYASTTQIGSSNNAYFATGGGSVGIGTAAPSSILGIGGALSTTNAYIGAKYLTNAITLTNTGANNRAATMFMEGRQDSAGYDYVGILQFRNSASSDSTNDKVIAQIDATTPETYDSRAGMLNFRTHNKDNNDIAIRMVINEAGNIGIATTTPGYKLSVSGDAFFDGGTLRASTLVATSSLITPLLTSTNLLLNGSTTLQNFTFQNATGTAATTTDLYVSNLASTTALRVANTAYIGGNVGIGTTAPASLLHVIGDVRANTVSISGANRATHYLDIQQSQGVRIGTGAITGNYAVAISIPGGDVGVSIKNTGTNGDQWLLASTDDTSSAVFGGAGRFSIYQASGNAIALTIDSSRNIGIGTTNPSSPLHVVGVTTHSTDIAFTANSVIRRNTSDASDTGSLEINGGGAGGQSRGGGVNFYGNEHASTPGKIELNIGNVTGAKLSVHTNAAEALTILGSGTNSGYVGIGTTTPQWKTQISGTAAPQLTLSDSGFATANHFSFRNSNGIFYLATSSPTSFATSTTAALTVDGTTGELVVGNNLLNVKNSGNVGIGTTGPGSRLHTLSTVSKVATFDSSHASGPYIDFAESGVQSFIIGKGSAVSGLGTGYDIYHFTASQPLSLYSADTNGYTRFFTGGAAAGNERLRITSGGNVGIATTTPSYKLSVSGSGFFDGGTIYTSSLVATSSLTTVYASTTQISSSNNAYFATSGGSVGIGTTSPWATLSVVGKAAFPTLMNNGTGYYACVNTAGGGAELATSTTACGASSLKYKENVAELSYGLAQVLDMRPVSFDWKQDFMPDGAHQIGFIAEEMELIVPEIIGYDNQGEVMNMDYAKLTSVLTKAIQEIANITGVFKDNLIAWLGDAANGIGDFFANRVHTKELCVGDENGETCITKSQLDTLLASAGASGSSSSGGSSGGPIIIDNGGTDTGTDGGTATSTDSNAEGAVEPDPDPEPAPETDPDSTSDSVTEISVAEETTSGADITTTEDTTTDTPPADPAPEPETP